MSLTQMGFFGLFSLMILLTVILEGTSPVSNFGSGHDVMVCEFEPTLDSVPTAQSLEPASYSVSPSLSAPLLLSLSLRLSLSKINKH